MRIEVLTSDAATNIALDTIKKGKQAIVFVNSKRSAEAQAEKIASAIKDVELKELSRGVSSCRPPLSAQRDY